MHVRTFAKPLAFAAPLALALAACAGEPADTGDDLPEPEIAGEPDAVSDAEIAEAVPGVEAADAEGDTPNDADLGEESNAEFTEDDGEVRED